MDQQLFKLMRDETEKKRIVAREGKSFLIYYVPQRAWAAASESKVRVLQQALQDLMDSSPNAALSLAFDHRTFPTGPIPMDLRVPDEGLYCRLTWRETTVDPLVKERIAQEVVDVFSQANLQIVDVTEDLDRVFLFVFGQ
ncbi:hypothetical protein [Pseudomonas sp. GL-B-19]|uniref:hypothetical protein n=1 Tax=Pseudomonas sp. GL-B-19 TaxID=2832393 RepID=UPI001CBB4CBF|nr:hypothetical protein [Pseudomonas sp. GL-B-19]